MLILTKTIKFFAVQHRNDEQTSRRSTDETNLFCRVFLVELRLIDHANRPFLHSKRLKSLVARLFCSKNSDWSLRKATIRIPEDLLFKSSSLMVDRPILFKESNFKATSKMKQRKRKHCFSSLVGFAFCCWTNWKRKQNLHLVTISTKFWIQIDVFTSRHKSLQNATVDDLYNTTDSRCLTVLRSLCKFSSLENMTKRLDSMVF